MIAFGRRVIRSDAGFVVKPGGYMVYAECTYVVDRCVRAGGREVDVFVHRTPGTLLTDLFHALVRWWG